MLVIFLNICLISTTDLHDEIVQDKKLNDLIHLHDGFGIKIVFKDGAKTVLNKDIKNFQVFGRDNKYSVLFLYNSIKFTVIIEYVPLGNIFNILQTINVDNLYPAYAYSADLRANNYDKKGKPISISCKIDDLHNDYDFLLKVEHIPIKKSANIENLKEYKNALVPVGTNGEQILDNASTSLDTVANTGEEKEPLKNQAKLLDQSRLFDKPRLLDKSQASIEPPSDNTKKYIIGVSIAIAVLLLIVGVFYGARSYYLSMSRTYNMKSDI